MLCGGGSGLLLLAAVAGYWVLERAERHKGLLKRVGQWVGGAIIVVSLVGVGCRVFCAATCPPGAMGMGAKGFCPFGFKAMPPPDTAP
jgi:hypothetical protein